MPDSTDKLIRLAELHEEGLLTREEFETQKARLMQGGEGRGPLSRGTRARASGQPVLFLAIAGVIAILLAAAAGFLVLSTSAAP